MGTIIIAGNTVLKDMTTQLTIWRGLRGKLKPFLFTFLSIYQIFRALMFSYYEGTSRAHVQYKPKEDVRQKEAGIQVSSALLNFEYPKFSRNPLERNYQYPGNSRPDLIWGEVAKLSKQFSEPKIRTDYDVNKIG